MSNLSTQHKWILGVAVVVALNAIIWFLGIAPSRLVIEEVNKEIQVQEDKESQLRQRLAVLEAIDREALEQEEAELFEVIPDAGLLREVMTELEAVAEKMGLTLMSMRFDAPTENDYQSIAINMNFSGSYNSLYDYIFYLENHSRLVLVESFNLQGAGDTLASNISTIFFAHDFDPYTPYTAPGRKNPFEVQ